MQRREALRLLMAGGVLPALPTNLFAFFQGAHPASGYTLRTLNPHQNDTVVAMIDQIIPATDTPGAKGARVNEFIDVILTEWADAAQRTRRMRHGNTIPEERDKQLRGEFFNVFKGITVHGYYTSEIGFSQELNLQIIPGAHHGCAPLPAEKKA